MFGVLVVVFCPDGVAALGFSLGERQIPLIVSLRVVRALLFGAGRIRWPPLWMASKWRCGSGLAPIHVCLRPFCMAHSLVVAGANAPCGAPRTRTRARDAHSLWRV